MKRVLFHLLVVIVVVGLAGCSTLPTAAPIPTAERQAAADTPAATSSGELPTADTSEPSAPTSTGGSGSEEDAASQAVTLPGADPFDLISLDNLYAILEDLTAIQAYSGWRNSASEGEAEALDYVKENIRGINWIPPVSLTMIDLLALFMI